MSYSLHTCIKNYPEFHSIIAHSSRFSEKSEAVSIPLEPFFRRHKTLEEYAAFLKWDSDYFCDQAKGNRELVRVGLDLRKRFNFPTLKDLLEVKRFVLDLKFGFDFFFPVIERKELR